MHVYYLTVILALTGASLYDGKPRIRPPVVKEPPQMSRPLPPKNVEPEVKEVKEKITSNTKVLQDGTGSQWSEVSAGTSLATTTTASIASIQRSETKIRHQLNLNLKVKGKLDKPDVGSVHIPILERSMEEDDRSERVSLTASLRSKQNSRAKSRSEMIQEEFFAETARDESEEELDSLSDDTVARESHVTDLLNEAVMMDTVLEDIQSESRKRPKNLMLGKLFTFTFEI